jgi:hypothetical protein
VPSGATRYSGTVELIFTSLLVIMAVAVLWFAGYVIYRLYSDQR